MTRQALTDREYRQLVDRSEAGIFCARANGALLACNAALARILGYASRDELLTRDARALWADPEEWPRMCAALETTATRAGLQRRGLRRDGGEVPVLVCLSAVEADAERRFEAVVVDLTERQGAEDLRVTQAAQRAVFSLATALAHEINNPLNVIRGNLELLWRTVPAELSRLRIRPAVNAADQIAELIRAMARINRLRLTRLSSDLPEMLDIRESSGDEAPATLP